MGIEQTSDESLRPLPTDVDKRLTYWHGLWSRSASYHYFFGVISVAASVISTSLEGEYAKVFSIIAAIATSLIGFMHPERRYTKFVRAWRVLDLAAMRYRHGLSDKAALIEAVEKGEALIGEYEEKVDAAAAKRAEAEADAKTEARIKALKSAASATGESSTDDISGGLNASTNDSIPVQPDGQTTAPK
jgi:hypothetical protein